jgi:hypothetical protein
MSLNMPGAVAANSAFTTFLGGGGAVCVFGSNGYPIVGSSAGLGGGSGAVTYNFSAASLSATLTTGAGGNGLVTVERIK